MKLFQKAKTAQKPKRVFIVDDHPVFREGLHAMIRQVPDAVVCGEAATVDHALDEVLKLMPDLVLLDISLSGKSGFELLQNLRAVAPDLRILVVSMHDEALFAERVIRLGGKGYVMKQEAPANLVEAMNTVLEGGVYLSRRASAMILGSLAEGGSHAAKSPLSRLTEREFEILRLIGEGRDNHEIAGSLNLSLKTVDTHRGNLRKKLGLKSNTELIYHAVRFVSADE